MPRIEVNLFDFFGDLRGRTVKVEWLGRLRDERRFDGVGDLIGQLRRDEALARETVGKTTLPGKWVAGCEWPITWLSLD